MERPVVIVGGGVSGLPLGERLARDGVPTVIVEKEDRLGGLARTFRYDGFAFDIGPHRFHSDAPAVSEFIRDALGDAARTIARRSSVSFGAQLFPWPLHPTTAFFRFPLRTMLAILRDLLTLYRRSPSETFRDYIVNMYGETLYRVFFEGYSSKFLGIPPELTHVDWAKTGIDRSIIDSRLRMRNLRELLAGMILPSRRPTLQFIYPTGGCDRFIDRLHERYRAAGGETLVGQAADRLETDGRRIRAVHAGPRSWEPALVVWTGPLPLLAELVGAPRPELHYLSLVCYNLMLTAGRPFPFQWCYHGSPDILFSRASAPQGFDPAMAPAGRRSLCLEVTTDEEKNVYRHPEAYVERLLADAKRERLLLTDGEVLDVKIERIPWAYPIYSLDYRRHLSAVEQALSPLQNLVRAGRLGLFWYNNMDHCIAASLSLAERIKNLLRQSAS